MIESVYQGVSYSDASNVVSDLTDPKQYYCKKSRFPVFDKETQIFEPYSLSNFEDYKNFIKRVKVVQGFTTNVYEFNPNLPAEASLFIRSYGYGDKQGPKMEFIEPDLMSNLLGTDEWLKRSNNRYLTATGLMAVVLRKSYGDLNFKQYVNENILKDNFVKLSINKSVAYLYKEKADTIAAVRSLTEDLDMEEFKWSILGNPYIFMWRD